MNVNWIIPIILCAARRRTSSFFFFAVSANWRNEEMELWTLQVIGLVTLITSFCVIAFPGYAIVEGRPMREQHLPCCGIGVGWFL